MSFFILLGLKDVHLRSLRFAKVYLVRPRIHREEMLFVARVGHYCAAHADACLVYHNGQPWLTQIPAPCMIEHGDAFTLRVPPDENTPHTCDAVRQVDPVSSS